MTRPFRFATLATVLVAVGLLIAVSGVARADVVNGGFELGTAVGNADNATSWDWNPDPNGERVNALTSVNNDNGNGTSGPHLIDPLAGNWFGYAENSTGATSAQISQSVLIDAQNPVLTFWWRFFTEETPGQENAFNDRFQVDIEGSSSLIQTVASVNGTAMITSGGPLWTPTTTNAGTLPGRNQSFSRYTSAWAFYSINASSMAGENVSVYFRISDAGGPHNQSSGFAVDKVEFIVPEPSTFVLGGFGVVGLIVAARRRRAK